MDNRDQSEFNKPACALNLIWLFLALAVFRSWPLVEVSADQPINKKAENTTNTASIGERVTIDLTMISGQQTLRLIRAHYKTPPPWSDGNQLSYYFPLAPKREGEPSRWIECSVVNIYSENLREITRKLEMKSIEVMLISTTNYLSKRRFPDGTERSVMCQPGLAIVTDSRIPRDWFVFEPKIFVNPEKAAEIKAAFPLAFRPAR